MTKLLMFSGSSRKDSLNKQLIAAAETFALSQGAEVTVIDLNDYDMPIYNGDWEEANGQPETANKLHDLIASHDALIIASPEYNGLPSPLLINAIDWVSRVDVKVYHGKKAAIISASPGGLGGLRGLNHLRTLLTNLNVLVVPQQVAVGGASNGFNADGQLKDERQQKMLASTITTLLAIS